MSNLSFLQTEKAHTGFGNEIVNASSYEDALEQAGLNWTVSSHPVFTELGGQPIAIPKTKAIVRNEDRKTLGIVTDKYKLVNNADAFAFTESIFKSQDISFERGGSYRGGKATWIEARVNSEYTVLGDKTTCYMIFMNSHDGTCSVRALMLPIRIACSNQLNFAIKSAARSWRCIHSGDPLQRIAEAKQVLLAGSEYMTALQKEAEVLNQKKLTTSEVEGMVTFLFPILPDMSQRVQEARKESREQLLTVYHEKEDLQNFDQNAYRFLSAVVDYVANVEGKRTTSTATLNRYMNIALGNPIIDKAYNLVR